MLKVFLVEDESIVREGLKKIFRGRNMDINLRGGERR